VGAEGADSQTAEARTKPVPVAPTDCSATVGRPRGIVLNWSPNPEADIAAYVVEGRESSRGRFRQIARVEASAGLEYEHRSLPAGCEFVDRIKAVDADGLDGAWSDEVAGSTKPLPSAPSQLQCAWDGDVARLTWTASAESDVERYNVKQLGFFGAKALCAADGTSADLAAGTIGKRIKVVVTAVDVDGLESEPSEVIEISSQSMGT
jgi:fibronectin type 3 domain-containing protein